MLKGRQRGLVSGNAGFAGGASFEPWNEEGLEKKGISRVRDRQGVFLKCIMWARNDEWPGHVKREYNGKYSQRQKS